MCGTAGAGSAAGTFGVRLEPDRSEVGRLGRDGEAGGRRGRQGILVHEDAGPICTLVVTAQPSPNVRPVKGNQVIQVQQIVLGICLKGSGSANGADIGV